MRKRSNSVSSVNSDMIDDEMMGADSDSDHFGDDEFLHSHQNYQK